MWMGDKLLPCPFCGGEADCNNTGCQDYKLNPLWWVECLGCGISTSGSKEKEKAINEWNLRADHSGEANGMIEPVTGIPRTENEPLTLEELRGMDGEPVWVETMREWRIVLVGRDDSFVRLYSAYNTISAQHVFNNEGRIYRQKTEGGEG